MCPDSSYLSGVTEVRPEATWKDLVLPKQVIERLHEFILWMTHRQQVEQWGARLMGGPTDLFSGPSGTGKRFSAEVIANALDRPLLRVDLGLLVSKYIGETEKNLDALFDAAANEGAMLLFDEALARIERCRSPCILISNTNRQIDPAFIQRVQMVIDFPAPDGRARSRLWRIHLPAKAPREKGLNLGLIGKQLVLTGGQIRNAALYAAFLAAGDSAPIGWKHIAKAALREISKTGTEKPEENLGSLRQHLG
jgi:SpoVK/Ycf46/Vps4 family AAA+-type ATPase